MKNIVFISIILLASLNALAQASSHNSNEFEEHRPLLYRNEFSYGLTIHTAGFGIDFRRGFHVTGVRKKILEFEFLSMKNSKEIKMVNPIYDAAKAYVYGKMNSHTIFRIGLGEQRILYGKADGSGIEIQFNYSGGLTLGLVKPIYLEVVSPPNQYTIQTVKYDPDKYYEPDDIVGRGPLFKGIEQTKFYPGIYGKFGFNFDWSSKDDRISSLEAGFMFDAYFKEIPVMQYINNNQFFVNFYVAILFGKKWYTN